jgi:hypothetical protein
MIEHLTQDEIIPLDKVALIKKLHEMIDLINQHENRLDRIQGIRKDQSPYDASIPRNRELR